MTTPLDLLNRPYRELAGLPAFADLPLPEPEELDDISGAEFTDLGFSVRMDDHVTIGQVVLYGGGEDGYAAYVGPLPHGLRFLMTPDEVHDLLGAPVTQKESEHIPGLGSMRPWDKYVYDDYELAVHYSLETKLTVVLQFDVP